MACTPSKATARRAAGVPGQEPLRGVRGSDAGGRAHPGAHRDPRRGGPRGARRPGRAASVWLGRHPSAFARRGAAQAEPVRGPARPVALRSRPGLGDGERGV